MSAIATTQPALDDRLDHAGWLRRLATGLVHDAGEAEDLAQEVFLVAARERLAGGGGAPVQVSEHKAHTFDPFPAGSPDLRLVP